jgi:signal transduction histidine kinase
MKYIFQILLFSLCFYNSSAQKELPDSIIREYAKSKNDTLRLVGYSIIAEAQNEINPDSSYFYSDKMLQLSRSLKLKLEEVAALGQMGYALTNLGNYPRALQTLLSGIEIAEDPESEKNVVSVHYPPIDELASRAATPHNQRLGKLSRMHQYMGILYGNANDLEKEKYHFLLANHIAKPTGNLPLMSVVNGTLGRVYFALKMSDSALIFQQLAYDQAVQSGYKKYRGSILLNLARVYSTIGNRQMAVEYFKKALSVSKEQNYLRGVVSSNLYLADLYLQSGNKDSGFYYIKAARSTADQLNAPKLQLRVYNALAAYYKNSGKSDSTVKYQGMIIEINDSLFNSKQAQEFQNIDFDKQQREQEREASEKAYQYRLRLYGLLTGLGIFLLLAIILWRNNRNRQKAYSLLKRQKQETDFQKSKVEQTLAELRSTQAQLIQSEKMASLGVVTAGIAHEIQNPLNFVNNFSEVNKELVDELQQELKAGKIDDAIAISNDIKENEEKINHHGKRADAIVKGMLQHSRSSSGIKEPTDINALADEYLRLAYHGLRAKDNSFNATMKTDYDESIGNINIIPQDIGRVILNLINNAFYAASLPSKGEFSDSDDRHEPTVWVSTKKVNNKVLISVRDNGPGIPQKILDKIFQPFFTTKPTGQGTGLGLSLSYDIVKAHGGELKVETKEGEGSEFSIQIPVSKTSEV